MDIPPSNTGSQDIRDEILKGIAEQNVIAHILAVEHGANIIFIDSGKIDDLTVAVDKLKQTGSRSQVKIAFGGNIQLQDIDDLKTMDVDILDIGRPIINAPLLDMRMEVIDISP